MFSFFNCVQSDAYPTSTGGKLVAFLAMLTGVLVIAFPVSIFSDLWSKQRKQFGLGDSDTSDAFSDGDPVGAIKHHLAMMEESQAEIKRLLQQMQPNSPHST